jgi:hypothetical protein
MKKNKTNGWMAYLVGSGDDKSNAVKKIISIRVVNTVKKITPQRK